jgi:hypothetical protein
MRAQPSALALRRDRFAIACQCALALRALQLAAA